ncbi:hypothetical protein TYRP_003723 [Tyrophagus putrescentiae]|nr:hypothetical protein TYRP_003723 [Tyrophagus putrescentiae]
MRTESSSEHHHHDHDHQDHHSTTDYSHDLSLIEVQAGRQAGKIHKKSSAYVPFPSSANPLQLIPSCVFVDEISLAVATTVYLICPLSSSVKSGECLHWIWIQEALAIGFFFFFVSFIIIILIILSIAVMH